MGGTITPNLIDISLCEADDWDGGVGALDIESQIQGSGCLTISYPGTGLRAETTETIAAANMISLGYPVIYGWLTFARLAMLETYANGGLRFIVKSSSTAWSAWKVAGSDTASTAGWACYCVRTNQTPDYIGTTAADLTNITQIGWIVNLAIKGIVKWDAFRYGFGLTMTAGTSDAPCTWDDIWAAENDPLKKYGIVTKYEGAYFVQGRLNFGDASGTTSTYFKDTSEVILFKDARVGTGFYDIKLQGNATGTTEVYFGTRIGEGTEGNPYVGISGCIFKSAGATKFTVTATNTLVTKFGFYGCTLLDADTISLPASYTNDKQVLNTNFEACAEVLPDICIVKNCNIISSDDRGLRIISSHHVTNCTFINCPRAVHIPNLGTYAFDYMNFIVNTYDIDNSSGLTVTVNSSNSSSPPSTYINSVEDNQQANNAATDSFIYNRIAQRKTISNRKVARLAFLLSKLGSPTGNITFTVRKVSDDSVLQSVVLGDAGALTTVATWYDKWFSSPPIINEEIRLCTEHIGASGNRVDAWFQTTDVKASEYLSRWPPAGPWGNTTTQDYTYNLLLHNPTVTTTIINIVYLTMIVKDEAGQAIVGAWAFIDQSPPESPYIMNQQTIAGGVAEVIWTGGAVSGSTWRVRKYGYKNFKQTIDIGGSNISLPITLVADPQT